MSSKSLKKLRRGQVLSYFANLKSCKVRMESCASSHEAVKVLSEVNWYNKSGENRNQFGLFPPSPNISWLF